MKNISNNISTVSYPYHWENAAEIDCDGYEIYIGEKKDIDNNNKNRIFFDPAKTTNIVNKASSVSKKILSTVEFLKTKEKEGGWKQTLIKPIRYLLEHLPSIQTLQAAKSWIKISDAFKNQEWDVAIDSLLEFDSSKEKEKVIQFPYSSFQDYQNKKGPTPRTRLFHVNSSVLKADWAVDSDCHFMLYLSLISLAYFNRALKTIVENNGNKTEAAQRDMWRARIYSHCKGRGMQDYTDEAILAVEANKAIVQKKS